MSAVRYVEGRELSSYRRYGVVIESLSLINLEVVILERQNAPTYRKAILNGDQRQYN